MAGNTNVNNSLVTAPKEKFSVYLAKDSVKKMITSTLGGKDGQRFMSAILSAVAVNPDLAACNPTTILSAALLGEGLKLSPSPQLGHYYMVPFQKKKNGKVVDVLATFVLGYKGYLQLAMRSGYYRKINVIPIKEGELQGVDILNELIDVMVIDDEDARDKAPTIGYYFMFEYLNGFRKAFYWSKERMLNHADRYSPAFKRAIYEQMQGGLIPKEDLWKYSSHWYKNFDDMAMKTMIRQGISKWGIMSVEMQQAFERDEAIIGEGGAFEFAQNTEDDPEVDQAPPKKVDAEVVDPGGGQKQSADEDEFDKLFFGGQE